VRCRSVTTSLVTHVFCVVVSWNDLLAVEMVDESVLVDDDVNLCYASCCRLHFLA